MLAMYQTRPAGRRIIPVLLSLLLISLSPARAAEPVTPSATRLLQPGQQIADLSSLTYSRDHVIQRLTEKTYWVSVRGYSVLFYIGDRGVVLFDAPGSGQSANVLDAIASVTRLPVTTLVYSHSHLDHIGGAGIVVEQARKQGVDLTIVATDKVVEEMERFSLELPAPTVIVQSPYDRISVEGLEISVHTPSAYAHRPDTSLYYLPSERVVQAIDVISADSLPYFNFNGAMDPEAFRKTLEQLRALKWDFLDAGHGNIASPDDVELSLAYYRDLSQAVRTASESMDKKRFYGADIHPYKSYRNFMEALSDKAYNMLKSEYGSYGGLEQVINGHVESMRIQQVLHNK